MPLAVEDSIDALYGCLKDLPWDPLTDLEAEHRAETLRRHGEPWPAEDEGSAGEDEASPAE